MIRSRFAPSPTGDVHVGSLRTALYNYLLAKQGNGEFILRLEDTDRTRLQENSVNTLLEALYSTNVIPDEGLVLEEETITQKGPYGPYIQSERLDIYNDYIQKLIEKGDAYYCFCDKERLEEVRNNQIANGQTPKYDGHCRNLSQEEIEERLKRGDDYVIRLKLPEDTDITFHDEIRGDITVNTNDLDDQVLIKADGFPTYHFAVVVDDHLMKITDVIRGEEWLPSTPKHVYLYDLFGWERPNYVHLPNILNKNHKKLSKREGDVSVSSFLQKGYLPEALINYLALLGWNPGNEEEFFTLEDLTEKFSKDRINTSGAVFDLDKLNWINSKYIQELSDEELVEYLKDYVTDFEVTPSLAKLLRERLEYFAQADELIDEFFSSDLEIKDEEMLKMLNEPSSKILNSRLIEKIKETENLTKEEVSAILKSIQKQDKIRGKMLYMPSRIMITNQMHGPDLAMIMEVLGKDEVLNRLELAQKYINEESNEES